MSILSLKFRLFLFCGSISPLLILQGLQEWNEHVEIPFINYNLRVFIPLILIGSIFLFFPLLLIHVTKPIKPITYKLIETRLTTPNLTALLLAYLIPVLGFSILVFQDFVALVLLIIFFGVVFTRAGLVHLQPIYLLVGWQIYEVKRESGEGCWVLTKSQLIPGDCKAVDLGSHIMIMNQ